MWHPDSYSLEGLKHCVAPMQTQQLQPARHNSYSLEGPQALCGTQTQQIQPARHNSYSLEGPQALCDTETVTAWRASSTVWHPDTTCSYFVLQFPDYKALRYIRHTPTPHRTPKIWLKSNTHQNKQTKSIDKAFLKIRLFSWCYRQQVKHGHMSQTQTSVMIIFWENGNGQ